MLESTFSKYQSDDFSCQSEGDNQGKSFMEKIDSEKHPLTNRF